MTRILALVGLLTLPLAAHAGGVTVFAASSLKAALDPAAQAFQAASGTEIVISYGSSSALAKQVDQGAPADLVVLAAENWMDYLAERERIVAETRKDLWGNALSLIAHDPAAAPVALDGSADLAAYLGNEPLAMALVDAVPVGQYGKAALQSIGQWAAVEPKVVQAEDARAAVALVASGQAGFGIVYATDVIGLAKAGQGVEVGRFPEASHDPIRYPAAVVADAPGAAAAVDFLRFLQGPEAQAIFAGQGYQILAQ